MGQRAGLLPSAYTRALKNEKSLSPPIPVGEGALDTNDWCIIFVLEIILEQLAQHKIKINDSLSHTYHLPLDMHAHLGGLDDQTMD